MEEWRKQLVGKLSTGMRKKVSILSACIHRPRLLFLDEPFSGLDPLAMQGLRDFIRYLLEYGELTIVIASHNLKELASLCDEVGIMKEGRMVISGPLADIKQKYGFEDQLQVRVDREPQGLEHILTKVAPDVVSFANNPYNIDRVFSVLSQQGINILDVSKQTAALEDVYQRVYQEGSL